MIAMKFIRFVQNPISRTISALLSTVQSTLFLTMFIVSYMSIICIQRKIVTRDHRFIYWIAGGLCALSILIEKKSRRAELALYALPRGIDSLYMLLLDRKWMASVPQGELLLFSCSIASIMYFYENEPHTMSPLFRNIIDKIVGNKSSSVEEPPKTVEK